jgi:RES domain-containing protein
VSQVIGDEWLNAGRGLALRVPSVHSQSDTNILLNPEHMDIQQVRIFARSPYRFDRRLF